MSIFKTKKFVLLLLLFASLNSQAKAGGMQDALPKLYIFVGNNDKSVELMPNPGTSQPQKIPFRILGRGPIVCRPPLLDKTGVIIRQKRIR